MSFLRAGFVLGLAFAGCAGAAAERPPLASGEAHATPAQCRAAVQNFENCEFQSLPYPTRVRETVRQVSPDAQRDERMRQCDDAMSAREADCVAHAQDLVVASACSPNVRW